MGSCSYAPTQAQTTVTDKLSSLTQADGVGFVDTWDWFCSDGVCPMIIGRTIAYLDRGHITLVSMPPSSPLRSPPRLDG